MSGELRAAIRELRVAIAFCRFCGGAGEQGDPAVATWECPWCAPARRLVDRYPDGVSGEVDA
jgi:hypothetical protein